MIMILKTYGILFIEFFFVAFPILLFLVPFLYLGLGVVFDD